MSRKETRNLITYFIIKSFNIYDNVDIVLNTTLGIVTIVEDRWLKQSDFIISDVWQVKGRNKANIIIIN